MSRNVELWATYTDKDLEEMEREEQRNILHGLSKDAARLRLQWIRDERESRMRVKEQIVGDVASARENGWWFILTINGVTITGAAKAKFIAMMGWKATSASVYEHSAIVPDGLSEMIAQGGVLEITVKHLAEGTYVARFEY